MKPFSPFLVPCILGMIVTGSALADADNLSREIQAMASQVQESIKKYDEEKNTDILLKAYKSLAKVGNRWKENPTLVRPSVLKWQLIILETATRNRDMSYDVDEPFQVYVPPSNENLKYAELRIMFEEARAENNRRERKFNSEKRLQRLLDTGLNDIEGQLNLGRSLGVLSSDISVIRNTVKDPQFMKEIEQEVLVHFPEVSAVDANEDRREHRSTDSTTPDSCPAAQGREK